MRQAGRILPDYRAVRASVSGFKELVARPELACEVTLQPVDQLGVDAAILFSDILEVPEAMGLPYELIEKQGPRFPRVIASRADLDRLHPLGEEEVAHVIQAVRLIKAELNARVPLIGFAGAPWTILCYMVEGHGSKTFSKARGLLYTDPKLAQDLLDRITEATINYLKLQIEAGCDLVQVFDSWAGALVPAHYQKYALPAIRRICEAITEVPVTVFAKGAHFAVKELGGLPCRTLGLDWSDDPKAVRALIGPEKTLQGNLDPCALYGSFDEIRAATREMLERFEGGPYIANLGHGVYPDTQADKVRCFVEAVQEFSSR